MAGKAHQLEAWIPDRSIGLLVAALVVLGLVMIFSTTFDLAYQEYGNVFYYVERQVLWAVLGVVAMLLLARQDYYTYYRLALPAMIGTVLLLLLLLFVGQDTLGARRAFLGGSLQPGELAKLTTLIYISAWASSKGEQIRDISLGLLPFSVLMGVTAGLVVLQPDLSTAAVIVLSCLAVFFVSGADLVQLLVVIVVGGLVFSLLVILNPYAQERLDAFVSMIRDPNDLSHHAWGAFVALGSGGVFGAGLGLGRQKFGYLPVPHTDSILAVIGEELGFIGCMIVVILFVILAWRGFRVARDARSEFGMTLACGITVLLMSQAIINGGVIGGLLPFTGMVLPFISMGGSSLVVSLAAIGILMSISRGSSEKWRSGARLDSRGRNGGARLSRTGRPAGR